MLADLHQLLAAAAPKIEDVAAAVGVAGAVGWHAAVGASLL